MTFVPWPLLLPSFAFAQTPPPDEPPPTDESEEDEEEEEPVTMRATRGGGARAVTSSQKKGEAPAYLLGAAYGGYVGGNIAYLVGEVTEPSGSTTTTYGEVVPVQEESVDGGAVTLGVLLGAGAGLGTAAIFTTGQEVTPTHVAAVGTGIFVGGFTGHNLAGAAIEDGATGRTERIQASQLAGTIGGAAIGLLQARGARSVGSNLHLDLATFIGWQTAAGVSDLAEIDFDTQPQERAGIALAGGLGGYTAAALTNPYIDPPRAGTVGLGLVDGAWLGVWAPYLFDDQPTNAQITGGLRLGLGAGYVGILGMSAFDAQPSGRSIGFQALGLAAGSALGAGIPLALGIDDPRRSVVAPMLAVGAAGQVGGALLAPRYEVSRDDGYLIGVLAGWAGYQAVGWGTYAAAAFDSDPEPLGFGLTAAGSGALIAMGAAPLLEIQPASSFQLLASGGWGTWFAAWGGELAGMESDEQLLLTMAGGNAALLGTAIVEGSGYEPSWTTVGLVNGLGAVGAAAGALVGVVLLYDENNPDPLVISALTGSAAGLIGGTVLASRWGNEGSGEVGMLPFLDDLPMRPSFTILPWADEENRPGVWMELRLDEVAR